MLLVSRWQFNCQSAGTAPDFRQLNDWRQRWDLVSHRNVNEEEATKVIDISEEEEVKWDVKSNETRLEQV